MHSAQYAIVITRYTTLRLSQSGHFRAADQCPLLGVKRTYDPSGHQATVFLTDAVRVRAARLFGNRRRWYQGEFSSALFLFSFATEDRLTFKIGIVGEGVAVWTTLFTIVLFLAAALNALAIASDYTSPES